MFAYLKYVLSHRLKACVQLDIQEGDLIDLSNPLTIVYKAKAGFFSCHKSKQRGI